MLEHYYVKPTTVDRIRSSWLSEPIDKYVSWLVGKKYSVSSISRRIPLLVAFGEFARAQGANSAEALPQHIEAFIDSRLSERGYRRKVADLRKQIRKEVRGPIEQMLECVVSGFEATGRCKSSGECLRVYCTGFFHLPAPRARTARSFNPKLQSLSTPVQIISGLHRVSRFGSPIATNPQRLFPGIQQVGSMGQRPGHVRHTARLLSIPLQRKDSRAGFQWSH
jgi:hypothetical protein